MLSALNKAIFFESISAKNKSGPILAERLRFKALVLIRSGKGKQEEIRKTLDKIQKLLKKYAQPDSRSVRDYKMILAWYYTYIEPDYEKVMQNMVFNCLRNFSLRQIPFSGSLF